MCIFYITKKGYENLYKEYKNVDMEIKQILKEIGESVKRDNDLRENSEFMQLRVKAMYELPAKKKEIWNQYKKAIIIEEQNKYINFDNKTVILGSVVTMNFSGDIYKYTILGTNEGNIENNILSCEAPISKAILGKKIGDKILFRNETIEILNVEKY